MIYHQPGVFISPTTIQSRNIRALATDVCAFVGSCEYGEIHAPTAVNSMQDFARFFGAPSSSFPLAHAVHDFFVNGGRKALVVRMQEVDEGDRAQARMSAMHCLAPASNHVYAESFNQLCLPPDSFDTDIEAQAWHQATTFCEVYKAMLLIDPPRHWSSSSYPISAIQSAAIPASANAVLYYPRLSGLVTPGSDSPPSRVPCGAMAGVMARTDTRRGVWQAPAGSEARLHGIGTLAHELTAQEISRLTAAGVNCLRILPRIGPVCWGARTLQALGNDNEFKYLPVRRYVLHIERSLQDGLHWVIFEANDQPLWNAVKRSVDNFLAHLFRLGSLQGRRTHDAYFVQCDRSTMSQQDIDNGRLVCLIGLALQRPGEFINLRLTCQARIP